MYTVGHACCHITAEDDAHLPWRQTNANGIFKGGGAQFQNATCTWAASRKKALSVAMT